MKNQTPQSPFDARYKPSYRMIKRIGDKSFDMQGPTGKVKRVSAQHLQFMYLTEYYVTALHQMEMFGITTNFINGTGLMPDLYKSSMMTGIQLWINEQCQQHPLGMLPWVIYNHILTVTICDPLIEMLCM